MTFSFSSLTNLAVVCSVLCSLNASAHSDGGLKLIDATDLEIFNAHYGNDSELFQKDDDGHDHIPGNHDLGPGWQAPGNESFQETLTMIQEFEASETSRAGFRQIIQPVSFINFIMTDGTGKVPYSSFQKQIDQLNAAYSASEAKGQYSKPSDSGIRFQLAGVRYVANNDFFNYCTLPSIIAKSRPKYMMDGAQHLNVYVCWCANSLGLSWLPYDSWFRDPVSESHYALGAIVHYELLPGNNFRGGLWSKGNILTHEVGHYYGLRHPYEGDCTGSEMSSDQISDTPRQSGNPLATCKAVAGRDSCKNQPGKDDMQTYMVATADTCRNHFTPGQVNYMQATIQKYKPTLMKQLPPACVAAVDSSDSSPDLQPCLDGTVKTTGGKQWCRTDPDDASVWAWACCPTNLNWDNDACRKGTPNFNSGNKPAPNIEVESGDGDGGDEKTPPKKKKSKKLRE